MNPSLITKVKEIVLIVKLIETGLASKNMTNLSSILIIIMEITKNLRFGDSCSLYIRKINEVQNLPLTFEKQLRWAFFKSQE